MGLGLAMLNGFGMLPLPKPQLTSLHLINLGAGC